MFFEMHITFLIFAACSVTACVAAPLTDNNTHLSKNYMLISGSSEAVRFYTEKFLKVKLDEIVYIMGKSGEVFFNAPTPEGKTVSNGAKVSNA